MASERKSCAQPTTFVAATSGPANLIATVVTGTSSDLYQYVSATLANVIGINHVETSITASYCQDAAKFERRL